MLYDGSSVQALGFTTHPCTQTCPSLVSAVSLRAHVLSAAFDGQQYGILPAHVSTVSSNSISWTLHQLTLHRRASRNLASGTWRSCASVSQPPASTPATRIGCRSCSPTGARLPPVSCLMQHVLEAVWHSFRSTLV